MTRTIGLALAVVALSTAAAACDQIQGLFEPSWKPIDVNGAKVSPLDLTTKLLFPMWQMHEGDEDFTVMRVIIEGDKGKKRVTHTFDMLDRYDRKTQTTSMARTTGYTCTAAVRMVAQGLYQRKGISPPEFVGREKGCWEFIRGQLAERGIVFHETIA